jgi:hypothetical protein
MSSCSSAKRLECIAPRTFLIGADRGVQSPDERELIPTGLNLPLHLLESLGNGFRVLAGIKR